MKEALAAPDVAELGFADHYALEPGRHLDECRISGL